MENKFWYCGNDVEKLTREELIEALKHCYEELRHTRDMFKAHISLMQDFIEEKEGLKDND